MIKKHEIAKLVHKLRLQGLTWEEIADKINSTYSLNYHRTSYAKMYKKLLTKDMLLDDQDFDEDKNSTISRKSNGELVATVVVNKNPANLSIEEVVELFDLDPKKWECAGFDVRVWNSMVKGKDGIPSVLKNYSVKAKFKPTTKPKLEKEDLSWLFDFANNIKKDREDTTGIKKNNVKDNVLVLPIFDAHLGKLAWGEETEENYDMKIASSRYRKAVKNIVTRANEVGFSKIIFPVGNDFFQFDNPTNETTKGTRVDSDLRWKKMFKLGVELLKESIDFCSNYAEVDVILVQGNHDNTMSFYAFEALRGWYNNNKLVNVDKDIKTRTYRRIGVNLLGFTHGDKEKDNLYKIMQQEARELWGMTKYSEWIIGHYHKNYVDERQGVTKRVIGSFSSSDAWHYENGYIGLSKTAQGLIYNKKQIGPYIIIYESVVPV